MLFLCFDKKYFWSIVYKNICMILFVHPLIVDIISLILLFVGLIGLIVAVIFTLFHANLVALNKRYTIGRRKVYGRCNREILKRYLLVILIAGTTMTACLLLRALLRGNSFRDYFLGPMLVYKLTFIPSIWVIGYFMPSKRKKLLSERKKRIKLRMAASK